MEWLRHRAPGTGRRSGNRSDHRSDHRSDNQRGEQPDDKRTPLPLLRLQLLLNQADRDPAVRDRLQALAAAFWSGIDAATLWADFGFGARSSLASELLTRLQQRVLPGTPETRDLGALFRLLFEAADAAWVDRLDHTTLHALARLLGPGAAAAQAGVLDAIDILVSAVYASGRAPALRLRMDAAALQDDPFRQLTSAAAALRSALLDVRVEDALREAGYLRALLDSCRRAGNSVLPHLAEYGVSVNIVFELDQLHGRTQRIEQLIDCAVAPDPLPELRRLLIELLRVLEEEHGLRALLARHYSLLARRVAERSAETGEHYITRDRAEYRDMLGRAAGGGAVIAGTTFAKFGLAMLALSPFWAGLAAGANYAISFVIVMLLHWTVATKQPAMTAPALAATLPAGGPGSAEDIEVFVDRVAALIRSQTAGIVGNVLMCVPLVLGVQWLAAFSLGVLPVGTEDALYVLKSITLLGPTALFAAFTGVLLFASSLIAGWAENWFVFHRLDSAIAHNPRIVSRLGSLRAQRWAGWWRNNISGLAGNISLGLLLGLVPAVAAFFALPLDVRHVTLASGQLAAAVGALGWQLLAQPVFWWCVAGIAVTGLLNVMVSFALAFKLALRSRGVRVKEQSRIAAAIRRRLWRQPLSFFLPPRDQR